MTRYVFTIPGDPVDPEAPVIDLTRALADRIARDTGTTTDEVLRGADEMVEKGFLAVVDPAPVPEEWVEWVAREGEMTEAEARATVDLLWMTGRIEISGRRYG